MNTENGITTDKSEYFKAERGLTVRACLTIAPRYKEIVWQFVESTYSGTASEVVASGVTDKDQTAYILGRITGNGPSEITIAEIIYDMFV